MSRQAASIAPYLIDALLEALPRVVAADQLQRPAGYAVEVVEGWPGDVALVDTVIIGNHRSDQQEQNLGARHRAETVTIDIEILIVRDGGTASDARNGAYEIAHALSVWARTPAGLTVDGNACSSRLAVIRYQAGLTAAGRSGWLHCELIAKFDRLT